MWWFPRIYHGLDHRYDRWTLCKGVQTVFRRTKTECLYIFLRKSQTLYFCKLSKLRMFRSCSVHLNSFVYIRSFVRHCKQKDVQICFSFMKTNVKKFSHFKARSHIGNLCINFTVCRLQCISQRNYAKSGGESIENNSTLLKRIVQGMKSCLLGIPLSFTEIW